MSPRVITALTFVLAAAVVGLYVLFVVWRYRNERRKEGRDRPAAGAPLAAVHDRVLDRLAQTAGETRPDPDPDPGPDAAPAAPAPVDPTARIRLAGPAATSARGDSIAELLKGIRLPADLVPLLASGPSDDVDSHIAFWTRGIPGEAVAKEFAGELVRLGFAVAPQRNDDLRAERDGAVIWCRVHHTPAALQDGGKARFGAMPEGAIVMEIWRD